MRLGEVAKSHQRESPRGSVLLIAILVSSCGFGNVSPKNFMTEARLCGSRGQKCIIGGFRPFGRFGGAGSFGCGR